MRGVKIVWHLAAILIAPGRPEVLRAVNSEGTRNLVAGFLTLPGNAKAYGKTYSFTGGEILSLREMAAELLSHRCRPKPMLGVPAWPGVLHGSRHKDGTARKGGMPLYKIIAGRTLTWMENLCFGLDMTDYHSGFLIHSKRALRSIPFERLSAYFDFDLEAITTARALGLHISEVGIPTRFAGEKNHLNPIRCGFRTLRVMARYRMGRYSAP